MKFNKSSQLLLVSAISLLAAGLLTACGTATRDFVFVASSKAAGTNNYGEVDVFEINGVSGYMRQIPSSPFPSGGRNPVAEAVSSDSANLYVVNQDDNTIVQFMIGEDGKLYPQNTVNTPGIYPLAVAVNGEYLFVVDTYQPLSSCSAAAPCSGSVGVFPIEPASGSGSSAVRSGELGTAVANGSLSYWALTLPSKPSDIIVPTAINVLDSGAYLYVTAYDSSVSPTVGYVFGFSVGSTGALTALNGGVPFAAGVHPSAIASDSSSAYVYVTDSTSGTVASYSVASGKLTQIGDIATGNQPSAIVADPAYSYVYVANAQDGNVEAYSITSSGALGFLGGSTTPVTYAAGIDPVAIGIDPATNHFVFTVNFTPDGTSGSVSNFELSATAGTLVNAQHSPYATNAQPVAVAAVSHSSVQKK